MEPNRNCRWHDGLCAFRDDDPERCPLCHCTWAIIEATDRHSCEDGRMWSGTVRRERMALARNARQAAQNHGTTALAGA